ncbi:unnamed protein product [Orchesella dallaii]|uniref:RING-type domain-containing protein n=1 Tax=Orchesella dallaii TaxID=48710 RepID=A0ABP1QN22_9HEXA
MEAPRNQLVTRKKTFWKMVKTIFLPAQALANLVTGCGSGRAGKVKRRLSMKNMHLAKEAFIQSSFRRPINRRSVVTEHVQMSSQNESSPTTIGESSSTSNGTRTAIPNESLPIQPLDFHDSIPEPPSLSPPAVESATATTSLHARPPLSLEEAELLLECLTLTLPENSPASHSEPPVSNEGTSHDYVSTEVSGHLVEVEVEVEISNEDIDIPSRSSFNDSNSSQNEETNNRPEENPPHSPYHVQPDQQVILRKKSPKLSTASDAGSEFHGWRRSSIEVTSNPPVTLAYIPSGLCVGDKIVWVKDDVPEIGTVRWIGKIRNQFYSGIEFDKPIGNSSGLYGYGTGLYKQLFTCKLSYGRFIPVKELVLYKDYHDTGIKSGIVCVICRDDFLETWEPDLFFQAETSNINKPEDQHGLQPFHMVSTKCGHLYHWGCLDEWFSTKKRIDIHRDFKQSRQPQRDGIYKSIMATSNSQFKNKLETCLNRGLPQTSSTSGSMVRRPQNAPPPIPPRNRNLSMSSMNTQGNSHSGTPDDSCKVTGKVQTPMQKRRLTLSISVEAANARAASTVQHDENEVVTCKSPKLETPGLARIWSPAICTICMEDLFAYTSCEPASHEHQHPLVPCNFSSPGAGSENSPTHRTETTMRPILSTRCGHLFHTECINKWFVEKKEKEIKECPFCKREMMANDTTRIFPIFDND